MRYSPRTILAAAAASLALCLLGPFQQRLARCQVPPPAVPNRADVLVRVQSEAAAVMRGEPLALRCVFTNVSGAPLTIAPEDHLAWATFELRDGRGAAAASWRPKIRKRAGPYPMAAKEYRLSAAPAVIRESAPSGLTDVPEGEYTLHLRTKIRYGTPELARSGRFWESAGFIEQDVVVPLTVVAADPGAMRERVGRLYRSIQKEKDAAKRRALSFELANMPPAFAGRAWRTLLLQSEEIDRYAFADALASVVTKEAADTLIYVQFTNPIRRQNGEIRSLVGLLNGMALSAATPAVRDYIRGEIQKRRGSIFNGPVSVD